MATQQLPKGDPNKETSALAGVRTGVSAGVGVLAGGVIGLAASWKFAPLVAWDVAALTYIVWVALALRGRDADQTANLAVREDPGHPLTDILVVGAGVASLVAVGVLFAQGQNGSSGMSEAGRIGLGVVSVVISWAVIHTVFMLHYARMFYRNKGGVSFNSDKPPRYSDFAYLAFTIGMTFQVSDTSFENNEFRRVALRHSLLSYLFGTVIVASMINLIAGLGK